MDGDEEGKEDKDVDMEITWEPNLDEIEEGEVGPSSTIAGQNAIMECGTICAIKGPN